MQLCGSAASIGVQDNGFTKTGFAPEGRQILIGTFCYSRPREGERVRQKRSWTRAIVYYWYTGGTGCHDIIQYNANRWGWDGAVPTS